MQHQPAIRLEPVNMFSSVLVYTDALGEVRGTVVEAADGRMLLWEHDFDCDSHRRALLIELARHHMRQLGSECKVYWGQSRMRRARQALTPPLMACSRWASTAY